MVGKGELHEHQRDQADLKLYYIDIINLARYVFNEDYQCQLVADSLSVPRKCCERRRDGRRSTVQC